MEKISKTKHNNRDDEEKYLDNQALRIIGKRNKVCGVLLNTTARTALPTYLATPPKDQVYFFPSEKTRCALTWAIISTDLYTNG
jgi:hypothetical protein